MFVTARRDHPDFWRRTYRTCPSITLDGELLDDVVEADDAAGYVVVYQRGPDGRLAEAPDGSGVATERREGKVEITGGEKLN